MPPSVEFGAIRRRPLSTAGEFVWCKRLVAVGEHDSAEMLGVSGEAFHDVLHADEDGARVVSTEVVADLLETGGIGAVSFGEAAQAGFGVTAGGLIPPPCDYVVAHAFAERLALGERLPLRAGGIWAGAGG